MGLDPPGLGEGLTTLPHKLLLQDWNGRISWTDQLEFIQNIKKGLRKVRRRNWRTKVLDCERWKTLVKEAKGHMDL